MAKNLKESLAAIVDEKISVLERIHPVVYASLLGATCLCASMGASIGLVTYLHFKKPEVTAQVYTPTPITITATPTLFTAATPTPLVCPPCEPCPPDTECPPCPPCETPTPAPTATPIPTSTPTPIPPTPTPQVLNFILPKNPYDAYWTACGLGTPPDYTLVMHNNEFNNVGELLEDGCTIHSRVIGPDVDGCDRTLDNKLWVGVFPPRAELYITSWAECPDGRLTNIMEHTYRMPVCPREKEPCPECNPPDRW